MKTRFTPLTKENQEGVSTFYCTTALNADGSRLRCRRNGKTKTWKRTPQRFQIPVKHGMYDYGYITEKEMQFWTID